MVQDITGSRSYRVNFLFLFIRLLSNKDINVVASAEDVTSWAPVKRQGTASDKGSHLSKPEETKGHLIWDAETSRMWLQHRLPAPLRTLWMLHAGDDGVGSEL